MPPNLPYATTITPAGRSVVRRRPHSGTPCRATIWCQARSSVCLHQQFGEVRQPVAHLHERQAAGQVRHGDAEHRRALELPQGLDLFLGIVDRAVRPCGCAGRPPVRPASASSRTTGRRAVRRAAAETPRSGRTGTANARRARTGARAPPRSRSATRGRPCGRRCARSRAARATSATSAFGTRATARSRRGSRTCSRRRPVSSSRR